MANVILPLPGGDGGQWGTKLNAALTAVNTELDSHASRHGADGQDPITPSAIGATSLTTSILAWAIGQAYTLTSATRDTNEAITTASVTWPDGTAGTFTTDVASSAFPGSIDSYHVTYGVSPVIHTYTQPPVTRDASGAVTAQPAIVVT